MSRSLTGFRRYSNGRVANTARLSIYYCQSTKRMEAEGNQPAARHDKRRRPPLFHGPAVERAGKSNGAAGL